MLKLGCLGTTQAPNGAPGAPQGPVFQPWPESSPVPAVVGLWGQSQWVQTHQPGPVQLPWPAILKGPQGEHIPMDTIGKERQKNPQAIGLGVFMCEPCSEDSEWMPCHTALRRNSLLIVSLVPLAGSSLI